MGSKLDELENENSGPIVQPTYIVCEGKSDAAFFFRLVRDRNMNGFQVGWAGGKSNFGSYLNGLPPRTSPRLRHLILVRDCDNDPGAAFHDLIQQLQATRYPKPTAPRTTVTGDPGISILMMPDTDRAGVLETLLVEAIQSKHAQLFQCVESYAQCARTTAWPIDKYSKMQLACMIAASCSKNPGCSLTTIWAEDGNPISLDHQCFDLIYGYLRQFAQ